MRHRAAVTEIEPLAPAVLQLTVEFTERFSFRPGQWVSLRFPEGTTRAYTIASAPQHPENVQLCIRLGSGRGGEALRHLEAGSEVSVDGPFGEFLVPADDARAAVFLAGDVGIAPVRSIVLDLIATGDPRPVTVLYEPDRRHILYAADFDPLARAGHIRHESGAIETLIERNRATIRECVLMAAGFDPFLDRVRTSLSAAGVAGSSLVAESFGPEPQ